MVDASWQRRWNNVVEWTLGLVIPLLVAGPICEPIRHLGVIPFSCRCYEDYIHQGARFEVDEGFGCGNIPQRSILEILTLEVWTFIPPIVSVIFYYRTSHDIIV